MNHWFAELFHSGAAFPLDFCLFLETNCSIVGLQFTSDEFFRVCVGLLLLFLVSVGVFSWSFVFLNAISLYAEAIALEKWNLRLPGGLGERCFLLTGFALATARCPGAPPVKTTLNPTPGLISQKGTWPANLPKVTKVGLQPRLLPGSVFYFFFSLPAVVNTQPSSRYARIVRKGKVHLWFTVTLTGRGGALWNISL